MSWEVFEEYVGTEVVCERKATDHSREKLRDFREWLKEVISRPEVIAVAGCIMFDCEDPTEDNPFLIIFIKKGQAPVKTDDWFEVRSFYSYKGVSVSCPGMVWDVIEVDSIPEFSKDDIKSICWCGSIESFTVWTKDDLKKIEELINNDTPNQARAQKSGGGGGD